MMNWDEIEANLTGPMPLAGENMVRKDLLPNGLTSGLANQDLMDEAWPSKVAVKPQTVAKLDVPNSSNRHTVQYGHTEADVEKQIMDWQRQQKSKAP